MSRIIRFSFEHFTNNCKKVTIPREYLNKFKKFFKKSLRNGFLWNNNLNPIKTFQILENVKTMGESKFSMSFIYVCEIERKTDKLIKVGFTGNSIYERMKSIMEDTQGKFSENGNTVKNVYLLYLIPVENRYEESVMLKNLKDLVPESKYIKKKPPRSLETFKVPETCHYEFISLIIRHHMQLVDKHYDNEIFKEFNQKIKNEKIIDLTSSPSSEMDIEDMDVELPEKKN